MKPITLSLILMVMTTPLYSQQLETPKELLSRATLGGVGELLARPNDKRAIYQLAKEIMAPPMTVFKGLSIEHQLLLVEAANESLSGDAYLEMVAAVLQGVADGSISPRVGSMALFTIRDINEGVLAVNHTDPRIAQILPKILVRYRDNPEESKYIHDLITGKAKMEHIEDFESNGLKPAQVITRSPSNAAPSSLLNASPVPKKAPETKPISPAPTEEPSSGLQWSVIAVLILGASALMWLTLKRRP